jgi:MerR family transcriptional regulator, thiopeptide resistance regulator
MIYSVKHLCDTFKISRRTLLYYDQIGILKASERSDANYRQYSEKDVQRMEQISIYRKAGVSLNDIRKILDSGDAISASILEKRLDDLNSEINKIRGQQHFIIQILKNNELLRRVRIINIDTWIALLNSMGFDEMTMHQWHNEFEKSFPDEHQLFLESLGLSPDEIKDFRRKACNVRFCNAKKKSK